MHSRILMVVALAAISACGGSVFTIPASGDGGAGGDGSVSGSSSGTSGSTGSSSSGGGSSSSSGTGSSGAASSSSGTASSSSGTASSSSSSSGSASSSGGSSSSSASSSGGSSSSSGGSSSGGRDAGGGSPCPANPPTGGAPCPVVGLECEYGTDANPACNEVERCTSSGWSYPAPTAHCTGMCPLAYSDIPVGKVCSTQGLDCSYPEGQCDCAMTLPLARMFPVWQCFAPGNGCPEPRPRLGSSCSDPNLSCNYGACYDGVAMVCRDGYWHQASILCPQ